MRITSKGQVTIPQGIREQAGLLPGSEVEFEVAGGIVTVKRVVSRQAPGMAAVRKVAGTANNPRFRGWNTDRIMQFLRDDAGE